MTKLEYPVNLEYHDDNSGKYYVGTYEDMNGVADGDTEEECLKNLELMLKDIKYFYEEDGDKIPEPSKPKEGQHTVTLTL